MTKHKYHLWHRLPAIQQAKKNTFYCKHPSCYTKATLPSLHNKVAACTICGNTFIVDVKSISDEMISVNCPRCLGVEVNETAQMFETFKNDSTNFLTENFDSLRKELSAKEIELDKLSKRITNKESKLSHQRQRLVHLIQQHRKTFTRRRNEFVKWESELKSKEKALKFSESTTELDREVIADSILTIFKKLEDAKHEHDGSPQG